MIAILSGFPRREGAEGAEQNHTFLSLRVLSTLCASDSGRFQTARGAEGFCPCTQTPGFLEDKCCVPQLLLYVGGVPRVRVSPHFLHFLPFDPAGGKRSPICSGGSQMTLACFSIPKGLEHSAQGWPDSRGPTLGVCHQVQQP